MYIGNNKIQDIYIGNNKIEKAYIGNNLVYEGVIPATFENAMRAELGPMGDEFIPMEHTTLQAGLYYVDFYVTTPDGAEINLLDAEHIDTIILKSNIEKTSITSQKLDQTFDVLYAPSVGNVEIRFTHSGKVYKVITEAHQLYKLLPEPSSSTFSFNDPDKAERTLHTFTQITFPDFNVTENLSDMISRGRMRSEYYIGSEKISSGTFDIKYLPDYGNGKQEIRFTLGNVFYNKPNYTAVSIEYKHSFTVQNSAGFPEGYNYISYIQDTQSENQNFPNRTNHSTIALPITMDKTKKYSIDAVIEPTGIFRLAYYGNVVFYGQQNTGGGICQGMGMFYNELGNNQLVFTFFQGSSGSKVVNYDPNNLTGKKMHIEHSSEHIKVTFIDTDEVLIDDDMPAPSSDNSNDYPSDPFYLWGGGIEGYYRYGCAPAGFKLYSFKLSIDDELVYDLVPAQNIETGRLGLVNLVDGIFRQSAFSKWPFISDDVNE